jgi:hypothetical protein
VSFHLDLALANLEKVNWSVWESVVDTSTYVKEIKTLFQAHLPPIAESISSEYHSYLCRKLAETFVPKFLASICRCRYALLSI